MRYYSDDITWCDNRNCPHKSCERNLKNRRCDCGFRHEYSVAHFEGTEYCIKIQQGKEKDDDYT